MILIRQKIPHIAPGIDAHLNFQSYTDIAHALQCVAIALAL